MVDDPAPDRISLPKAAWRAIGAFRAHQMTDNAAALTYYAMMSLFPAILLGATLLGIFGAPTLPGRAAAYVADHGADKSTAKVIKATVATMTNGKGGALGAALAISIALGLNGASGAFGAAGRALNKVHGADEDRGFIRRKLSDLAATFVVLLLFLIVIVALFLGGGIADDLLGQLGLGDSGATIWSIVRWPVAIVAAMLGYAIVYAYAPDVEPRRLRWLSPGAVGGVLVWVVASIGFAFYARNLSSYGAAYGAAGAVIVLLLWLWISACAFLLGAELNAQIEREQTAGRGGPPFPTPPPSASVR